MINKLKRKKKYTEEDLAKQTVQEFVNVLDIKDKFLYTRDGYIITYIQVPSIDINLLNDREKRNIGNTLTAEFSGIDRCLKFLAISRPVDISPLLADYQQIYSDTSNLIQKELLKNEMKSLTNFALSGEIVERQFYIMIWEKYEEGIEKDIIKRSMEIVSMFASAGIQPSILVKNDIIRLCNLINNPAFVNLEETSVDSTIPLIANL